MRANEFINEGMWDRAKEWANQKVYNLTGSENAKSAAVKTNFLRTFNGKLNAYINSTKSTNTTDIPHFIQSYLIQNKFMDPNHPDMYSQNAKLNTEVGRVSGELTAKPNDNMLKTTLGNLIYQVATTASAPMAKTPVQPQSTFNNQPNANYNTTPISNIPTQPSTQPTVATQTPNVNYNSTTVGKPAMKLPSYSANITQPTQTTQPTQPAQTTQPTQATSIAPKSGSLTGWQNGSTASAPQPNATPRRPRSLSQVVQNPNFGK